MQSSTVFIGVSSGHCTSWSSIDIGHQLWFVGSALSDTLIAISMTALVIIKSYERENFKHLNLNDRQLLRDNATAFRGRDILRRIVMLTIETNTITATAAIIGLIMWKVFPVSK